MSTSLTNRLPGRSGLCALLLILALTHVTRVAGSTDESMQRIDTFLIDRTEVTVGAFAAFVEATGTETKAEARGGGQVYAAGWEQRKGWTWRAPYGTPANANEPAVHVTFDEAQAYCTWAGKRLPTDEEWMRAAYVEHRGAPPAPFQSGHSYPYPTGATPLGAHCLGECGSSLAIDRSDLLDRGAGHAPAGTSAPGVNGLHDMGANVWEWVDSSDAQYKRTRGGSWWYGAAQMHRDHVASKPREMAVVYIGFRCAKDDVR